MQPGFQGRADFRRTHRAVIDDVDVCQADLIQFGDGKVPSLMISPATARCR
jgi:hypothetical protein